jgi:hypothetical protein
MNRAVSRSLLAVLALALAAGLLWLLYGPVATWLAGADLDKLAPNDRTAALGAGRGQVTTFLSAAFVAGGLYYSARRFFLDRDKQYTDRFTSAVNQLGSTDITVRAGGHRALDRILHDSPRDRDRVLRTVTGYLRAHPSTSAPVPDDVLAALAVLRDRGKPPRGHREVLVLGGAVLAHADLSGFDLRAADLTGCDLRGARLVHADLREARLDRVNLAEADLTDATLAGAHATKAALARVVAHDTDFSGCNLTDAGLVDADLSGATLTDAILVNADIAGADLRTVRGLTASQLRRARRTAATSLAPGLIVPQSGDS